MGGGAQARGPSGGGEAAARFAGGEHRLRPSPHRASAPENRMLLSSIFAGLARRAELDVAAQRRSLQGDR